MEHLLHSNKDFIIEYYYKLKTFLSQNYFEKKEFVENIKNDSLDVSLVLLNDKNLYKIKRSDFEKISNLR